MARRGGSGQAVLEFAIFASFMLVCLSVLIQTGMFTMLSENVRMTGFRDANRIAKDIGSEKSQEDPKLNLILLKDKFIPTPGRHFGAADTVALGGQYDPVYSTMLNMTPGPEIYKAQKGLPKIRFSINAKNDNEIKEYTMGQYSFQQNLDPNFPFRIKESNPDKSGAWWRWAGTGGVVYARSQDSGGDYYVSTGAVNWIDNDGDGKYETPLTVVDIERSEDCPGGYCYIKSIVYIDPRIGDINGSDQTVNPATGLQEGQGLQGTYTKIRNSTNQVTRDEDAAGIKSTGSINNQVTISRVIKTNYGGQDEIKSNIQQNLPENFNKAPF